MQYARWAKFGRINKRTTQIRIKMGFSELEGEMLSNNSSKIICVENIVLFLRRYWVRTYQKVFFWLPPERT